MAAQQSEVDAQKAALLTAIAQQGSQGQVAFQAEQARRQAAQQAAAQAISGQARMTGSAGNAPREFTAQLQGQQKALGDIYAQNNAMANQTFNNSIAQTSAANAAYMDQARAAVPVVNAQTQGIVAQLRAEQEAARADQEFRLQQMRLDAEEAARERAFAEEERAFEREMRELDKQDRLSERDDAADEERQLGSIARAKAASPVAGEALSEIVGSVGDYRSGVIMVDSAIDTAATNQGVSLTDAERKAIQLEIQRRLVEVYDPEDTGGQIPESTQELGELMKRNELNPATRLPGYMSARDVAIAKGRQESASLANERVQRVAQAYRPTSNRRAVFDAASRLLGGRRRPYDWLTSGRDYGPGPL